MLAGLSFAQPKGGLRAAGVEQRLEALLGDTAAAVAHDPEDEVESADVAPPKRRRVASSGGQPGDAGWEAQLAKLEACMAESGDSSAPVAWAEDPGLGRWVTAQRAHKKRLDRGQPSFGMTAARAAKLEALGFM